MNLRSGLAFAVVVLVCLPGFAQDVAPYTDPGQLEVPWPKHSFYKQPWRGYVETRSGEEFLRGVGINYHSPGANDELAIRLLAQSGIRTARLEVGFGSVNWEETGLNGEKKTRAILELLKKHDIRPTLLLNAHHGVPCPVKFFSRKAAVEAPAGATRVILDDVKDLVVGHSGINAQNAYWAAAHLITAIDPAKKEITFSRPLTQAIKAGEAIKMATLKYAPLHPVGTPQFEQTAQAWVRYAKMYAKLAAEAGHSEFDVEIWNELSFGSNYTQVKNYYAKDDPAAPKGKDFLNPGGCCWELSKRTIEALRPLYPGARFIFGFSNTTFHHTAIDKLPPGMQGQSYHPYGTGSRKLPQSETHKDRPEFNVERFTPTIDVKMPEGWAHTWIQTECLIRHLRPDARLSKKPGGTERFYHYMTEHGVVPAECGINEEGAAWRLKALCATRSFLLWMNKGMDAIHYFQAVGKDWKDMGILPANIKALPADAKWEEIATPPMRAIRRMTDAFAGAKASEAAQPIGFELTALGEQRKIFEGDAAHPPLWEREVVALLPWQLARDRFVIAAYVMSYDATKATPETDYRISIKGLPAGLAVKTVTDLVTGQTIAPKSVSTTAAGLVLTLSLTDSPRMIAIEK